MAVLVVPAGCSWTAGYTQLNSCTHALFLSATTAKHEIRHQEREQCHHGIFLPLRQSWLRKKARLCQPCQVETTDWTIKKRHPGNHEEIIHSVLGKPERTKRRHGVDQELCPSGTAVSRKLTQSATHKPLDIGRWPVAYPPKTQQTWATKEETSVSHVPIVK